MTANLSPDRQQRLLKHQALQLAIGPLLITLGSGSRAVSDSLQRLYAAHPKFDAQDPARPLSDIIASVSPTSFWRRWLRPQHQFYREGQSHFLPLPAAHAPALFEWGINYAIASSCHQWLLLHGAVVAKDNQALLLPAASGSGKSTLCAALVCHGWRLLSDEFVIIEPKSGQLLPLPRPISLKNQSIDLMQRYHNTVDIPVVIPNTNKGTIGLMTPPAASVAAQQQTASPLMVISPRWQSSPGLQAEPLGQAETLMLLAGNSFNYPLWQAEGFELLATVASQAAGFTLNYQDLGQAVAWIEQTFASRLSAARCPHNHQQPHPETDHATTAAAQPA